MAYNNGMLTPEIRLQFARRLKALRKRSHLTQEKMAERLNMDTRNYQRLESNKPGAVKIDTIDKIAKALKLTPSKLLDFK
jgi:transcriptional regulator with XRE-family HTH domain